MHIGIGYSFIRAILCVCLNMALGWLVCARLSVRRTFIRFRQFFLENNRWMLTVHIDVDCGWNRLILLISFSVLVLHRHWINNIHEWIFSCIEINIRIKEKSQAKMVKAYIHSIIWALPPASCTLQHRYSRRVRCSHKRPFYSIDRTLVPIQ